MRWIIFLLLMLFVVPLAMADVSIEQVDNSKYNYGDSFDAVFDVNVEGDFKGYVNLIAGCDTSLTLDTRMLDLKAGGSFSYSESYLVTNDFLGSCILTVERTDEGGTVLESASTGSFSVVSTLNGEFDINQESFQLGDSLHFSGAISDMNGMAVDGFATVLLKKDGVVKFVESKEIIDGVFYYDRDLSMVPAGDYVIEVKVSDSYGNAQTFGTADSFRLYGGMIITSSIADTYAPGDLITLDGKVKGDGGNGVRDIDIELVFESYFDTDRLEDSSDSFEFEVQLAEDIKSGEHKLVINADDVEGNSGALELSFTVSSIPSLLEANVVSFNHLPEKDVEFVVNILDQAGDNIEDLVAVDLYDPSGDKLDGKYFDSGVKSAFTLPAFAEPDEWTLTFSAFELSQEVTFKVEEIVDLQTSIEGQEMKITNLGNVDFDDEFHLVADGLDFFKNLDVNVNDTEVFDLGKVLDDGTYDIFVPFTSDTFSPVVVTASGFFEKLGGFVSDAGATGASVFTGENGAGAGIALAVILFVGVFAFGAVKIRNKNKGSRKQEIHKGLRKKQELKGKGKKIKPYESYNANDVAYLRKQAQDAYEAQKDKPTVMGPGVYVDARPKPEPVAEEPKSEGNIFDMFK